MKDPASDEVEALKSKLLVACAAGKTIPLAPREVEICLNALGRMPLLAYLDEHYRLAGQVFLQRPHAWERKLGRLLGVEPVERLQLAAESYDAITRCEGTVHLLPEAVEDCPRDPIEALAIVARMYGYKGSETLGRRMWDFKKRLPPPGGPRLLPFPITLEHLPDLRKL